MPITPTLKYLYGETSPLIFPVATAIDLEVGDATYFASGSITPADELAWGTAVTTAAPVITDGVIDLNTGLTAAVTSVKVSYNFPWGEGTLSDEDTVTPTAQSYIILAAVALPTPAVSRNVYVESAAGSGIWKLYATDEGGVMHIMGYGIGRVPPTAKLQAETTITQYTFAQAFAGISGQIKGEGVALVSGNSTDNVVRVNTGGVYRAPCASTTWKVGDFVNMKKDTGDTLMNQTVERVALVGDSLGHTIAIGMCVKAATSATTVDFVLIRHNSEVF